jgi:hypothetical protein
MGLHGLEFEVPVFGFSSVAMGSMAKYLRYGDKVIRRHADEGWHPTGLNKPGEDRKDIAP